MNDSSPTCRVVERWREGVLEAVHCGSAVAISAAADFLFRAGDCNREVLPRSAAKLLLALPYLASGAATGQPAARLALAAASHGAEPAHLEALARWGESLAISSSILACGPDWPLYRGRMIGSGEAPGAFHNNNAGKHLAVLATCRHLGDEISGYCADGHPAQERLMQTLNDYCDLPATTTTLLDNCGMRTRPVPLAGLALGMARLASEAMRPGPAARLLEAVREAPLYLAGSKRLVSAVIVVTQGRIIAKGGSEGVFAALDRERLIGHALKINDGSSEAASAAIIEWLAATGSLRPEEAAKLRSQTGFWRHAFVADRSPEIRFPFVEHVAEGTSGRKVRQN